jgi:hypothetical protein
MAKTKVVQPGVRTVAALSSKPSDMWVPGWDKRAGQAPHQQQIDREAMGQKMTPIGPGKLKKG